MAISRLKEMLSRSEDETLEVTDQDEPGAVEIDDFFDCLRNSRRRHVIRYFEENDTEEAELGELRDYLLEEIEGEESQRNEGKAIYVALYQVHLPKMEDWGIVDLNGDYDPVRVGETYETMSRGVPSDEPGLADEERPFVGAQMSPLDPDAEYIVAKE